MKKIKISWRKNKGNFILFIILSISFWILLSKDIINLNHSISKNNNHFNLLTVNSIFAGFLFTGLSIMISVSDKPRISRLDEHGYLDEYYNTIYLSLFFHIVSILSTILLVLIFKNNKKIIFIERSSLIFGLIFFVKSIFNLTTLIKKVRKN